MKKLYLVKREVLATSIYQAMRSKGTIYSVEEAQNQPDNKEIKGFKQENGNKTVFKKRKKTP